MRTDELIKKDLINQLAWDDRVDASNIQVTVDRGKVTLSGDVPSFSARQAATTTTLMVSGVLDVNNELTLSYDDPTTLPSDVQIYENIVNALRWDPDLRSFNIGVTVNDGWVTLEGTVPSYDARIAAHNSALYTTGVTDVEDRLLVREARPVMV